MLLSDVEGLLEVVSCIGSCQLVELYQVRSGGHMMMFLLLQLFLVMLSHQNNMTLNPGKLQKDF